MTLQRPVVRVAGSDAYGRFTGSHEGGTVRNDLVSHPRVGFEPSPMPASKTTSEKKEPAKATVESSAPSQVKGEVKPNAALPGAGGAPAATPGPAPARRPLGAKEVIQFVWKLVGISDGLALTLFKSVEKEEAEAQHERLAREGYYTQLAVVDINAKIPAPRGSKKSRVSADKAKEPAAASKTSRRDPPARPSGSGKGKSVSHKPESSPTKKPATSMAKSKPAAAAKTTKKKPAGKKTTATAKKKAKQPVSKSKKKPVIRNKKKAVVKSKEKAASAKKTRKKSKP